MAKRCEVCDKGPVVGRTVSHAHNVGPRRFEPNLQTVKALINGADEADPRLHALPALRQGHQGRLTCGRQSRRPHAPQAIGPYSPAIRAGNLLFLSGQIPIDPATGNLVAGDIAAQTEQVMRNIGALLKAAGAGFEHVVRTTVFLADMNDFGAMNAVYGQVRRRSAAGPRDGAGRAAAARCARRNRRDRGPEIG